MVESLQPEKKRPPRKNPWGTSSYADLITQAILSSPEKKLTLSQIYDWMVRNIEHFSNQGNSNSSAGWKNSIRHNLSLHKKFFRVKNEEGVGKSSWWTVINSEGSGRTTRRKNLPSKKKRKSFFMTHNSADQRLSATTKTNQQFSSNSIEKSLQNSSEILNSSIRELLSSSVNLLETDSLLSHSSGNSASTAEIHILPTYEEALTSAFTPGNANYFTNAFDNGCNQTLNNPNLWDQNQLISNEVEAHPAYNESSTSFNLQPNCMFENHVKHLLVEETTFPTISTESITCPQFLSGSYMTKEVPIRDNIVNSLPVIDQPDFSSVQLPDFCYPHANIFQTYFRGKTPLVVQEPSISNTQQSCPTESSFFNKNFPHLNRSENPDQQTFRPGVVIDTSNFSKENGNQSIVTESFSVSNSANTELESIPDLPKICCEVIDNSQDILHEGGAVGIATSTNIKENQNAHDVEEKNTLNGFSSSVTQSKSEQSLTSPIARKHSKSAGCPIWIENQRRIRISSGSNDVKECISLLGKRKRCPQEIGENECILLGEISRQPSCLYENKTIINYLKNSTEYSNIICKKLFCDKEFLEILINMYYCHSFDREFDSSNTKKKPTTTIESTNWQSVELVSMSRVKQQTKNKCKLAEQVFYGGCYPMKLVYKIKDITENPERDILKALLTKVIDFSKLKAKELSLPAEYIETVLHYLNQYLPLKLLLVIFTEFALSLLNTKKISVKGEKVYTNFNKTFSFFLNNHCRNSCDSTTHILTIYLFSLIAVVTLRLSAIILYNTSDLDPQEDIKTYFLRYIQKIKVINSIYSKGVPVNNSNMKHYFKGKYFLLPSQTEAVQLRLQYPLLQNILENPSPRNCQSDINIEPNSPRSSPNISNSSNLVSDIIQTVLNTGILNQKYSPPSATASAPPSNLAESNVDDRDELDETSINIYDLSNDSDSKYSNSHTKELEVSAENKMDGDSLPDDLRDVSPGDFFINQEDFRKLCNELNIA